jgi:hypothetical protein
MSALSNYILAREQHTSMVDTELLGFEMQHAEYKLADIAHDTDWHKRSTNIFLELFPHAPEKEARTHATQLLFTIKMALLTLLPHLQSFETTFDILARDVPAMQNTVMAVLTCYFDCEEGGYACPLFKDDDDEQPAENQGLDQ